MRWKQFFGMQDGTFNITGKRRVSREVERTWKGFIYTHLTNVDPRLDEDVTADKIRYTEQNGCMMALDGPLS